MVNAIYHFWSDSSIRLDVGRCEHSPIILSIATLRAHSDIPIYVIDATPDLHNWGNFPTYLNFQVRPVQVYHNNTFNSFLTQKVADVCDLASELGGTCVYVDSDIFWIKPAGRFNTAPLRCDEGNSGFYYFSDGLQARMFLTEWKYNLLRSTVDVAFRDHVLKTIENSPYKIITDESVMIYTMKRLGHLTARQNEVAEFISNPKWPSYNAIHVMTWFTKQKKQFCLGMREVWNCVQRGFNRTHLDLIFDDQAEAGRWSLAEWEQWKECHPNKDSENPLLLKNQIKL